MILDLLLPSFLKDVGSSVYDLNTVAILPLDSNNGPASHISLNVSSGLWPGRSLVPDSSYFGVHWSCSAFLEQHLRR